VNPQPWYFTNNSLCLPHAPSLSVCLFLSVCGVCGARDSEAQRAEAVACHQGLSTTGGKIMWGKFRWFICIFLRYLGFIYFFHWCIYIGGLSNFWTFFFDTGGLSNFFQVFGETGGLSKFSTKIQGVISDIPSIHDKELNKTPV